MEQRGGEDPGAPAGAAAGGAGQAAPGGSAVARQVLRCARPVRVAGAFLGRGEPADRVAGGLRQSGTDPAGERARRFAEPGAEAEVGQVVAEFRPGGVGAVGIAGGVQPPHFRRVRRMTAGRSRASARAAMTATTAAAVLAWPTSAEASSLVG